MNWKKIYITANELERKEITLMLVNRVLIHKLKPQRQEKGTLLPTRPVLLAITTLTGWFMFGIILLASLGVTWILFLTPLAIFFAYLIVYKVSLPSTPGRLT